MIITGKVEKSELLKALEPVEESIIKKGPLPEMQRPWISTGDFPNLEKDITETVLFADEDESMGSVLLAWNGPMCHVSFYLFLYIFFFNQPIRLPCRNTLLKKNLKF